MIRKVMDIFESYTTLFKYKLIYGKKFEFDWSDRVKKTLKIRISDNAKIVLGKNVIIRDYVVLNASGYSRIDLKDGVFLNDFICINARKYILIDENAIIGQGSKFYDHDHDYKSSNMRCEFTSDDILIGKDSWIGADCDILKGTSLGKNSIIGANTLIKKKINDKLLVYNKIKICEKSLNEQ